MNDLDPSPLYEHPLRPPHTLCSVAIRVLVGSQIFDAIVAASVNGLDASHQITQVVFRYVAPPKVPEKSAPTRWFHTIHARASS